jgi:hypothetical protein
MGWSSSFVSLVRPSRKEISGSSLSTRNVKNARSDMNFMHTVRIARDMRVYLLKRLFSISISWLYKGKLF